MSRRSYRRRVGITSLLHDIIDEANDLVDDEVNRDYYRDQDRDKDRKRKYSDPNRLRGTETTGT
ncbi:hypothetical protein [Mycobacterium sp.]|uniref:hypothetical protein n=1 Tax=Mycobacterium sp. TaxID=1785 RepID=UPI003F98A9CF